MNEPQTPEKVILERMRRLSDEMDSVGHVLKAWGSAGRANRMASRLHGTSLTVKLWVKEATEEMG